MHAPKLIEIKKNNTNLYYMSRNVDLRTSIYRHLDVRDPAADILTVSCANSLYTLIYSIHVSMYYECYGYRMNVEMTFCVLEDLPML